VKPIALIWPARGLIAVLCLLGARVHAADTAPNLTLQGQLDGHDNQTYRSVPFDVPAGTARITVAFDYSGHDEHTTIDLGLLGPDGFVGQDGFRGWSGGSKQVFTVSSTDATPAYLPGPIRPGRWTLLLGIPNIRAQAHASYTARIWFGGPNDPPWQPSVLNPPLNSRAGWYRGDLHMHSGHSDGSCASQSGEHKVPCPLFLTAQAAAKRGLDFIALSEHNTASQLNELRALQPWFDQLLLMPARELTSFQGHANLFGVATPLDFRVGSAQVPDWNTLLRQVQSLQGLISINHPVRPSGEICMGCGWTAQPAADLALVQAIEAVNGRDAQTPYSGIPFWQAQLDRGYRLTAIGGSDNHNALLDPAQGGVGSPTTVVYASELSQPAILAGIRAGHVFIDVQGSRDRLLELSAQQGAQQAQMGDALPAPRASDVALSIHVVAVAAGRVELLLDGQPLPLAAPLTLDRADQQLSAHWRSDGARHWLRANVYDADDKLVLVGNPVYLNPAPPAPQRTAGRTPDRRCKAERHPHHYFAG
jgi:hypothetical protein